MQNENVLKASDGSDVWGRGVELPRKNRRGTCHDGPESPTNHLNWGGSRAALREPLYRVSVL